MRRTMLAAMIATIIALICCVSSSWAFWPFTGDDQRKTHESLDVLIEAGAETAKEGRDTSTKVDEVISKTKVIQKDLRRGLGGLKKDFKKEMAEIKKENIAHNANIKPILTAMGLALAVILILMLILIFSRKKFPEGNFVKTPPAKQGPGDDKYGKCSVCGTWVKITPNDENLKRHIRRSTLCKTAKKAGKKVELILA